MASRKRNVARSPEDLAKKRDLILDAAMTLLTDKGYTKTTMSDVATAADIGRGTVYWHFKSKDDLFFALVTREIAQVEAAMAPLAEMTGPAMGVVDAMIRVSFEYYQAASPFLQALLSILGGADEEMEQRMAVLMSEMYGQYNQFLADLLERGKVEGDVRPELDSEITAAAIAVLLDAMFLQVGFGLVPSDADRLTRAVSSLIHHGCVPCPVENGANDA